jgi:hypothetical protein
MVTVPFEAPNIRMSAPSKMTRNRSVVRASIRSLTVGGSVLNRVVALRSFSSHPMARRTIQACLRARFSAEVFTVLFGRHGGQAPVSGRHRFHHRSDRPEFSGLRSLTVTAPIQCILKCYTVYT